jgi:hypothetical protein
LPAPRQLLLELPFWITFLVCALVPGSLAPWLDWDGVPLRGTEVLIALAALAYLAVCLPRRLEGTAIDAWKLIAPFAGATVYAAATTTFGDLDQQTTAAMRATLVFALAGAVVAAAFIDSVPQDAIPGFLWRLTVVLAAISALYSAESILSLGLRTEAGRALMPDFGIDRVRGPLYGSATGYVALLPALGFAVQQSMKTGSSRWQARLVVMVFLIAILGMGSRAGLILTGLYVLVLMWALRRLNRRAVTFAAICVLGGIAAVTVFSRANSDRLRTLEDSGRELTHRAAWAYLKNEAPSRVAAGAGYGSVWSWYLRDAQSGDRIAAGDNLIWTPYGPSLYHSHSTALTMAIELGATGVAAFALQLWLITRMLGQSRSRARWQAVGAAVAVASLGFFFDLFLFKNTTVNLIWWVYAVGMARLLRGNPEAPCGFA